MIEGLVVKKLDIIADERGSVMHMLRADDPEFEVFGEIYFSTVFPGVVKGWHLHRRMTLNYAVVFGMIKLVLFDDRPASSTRGKVEELFIGEQNYTLVKIPPEVWNGFKGIGVRPAIVANCATLPHDPAEIVRLDPMSREIPYDWQLVNR
jgi:dTDP-4-dehydrorhamnose 3,5-epimerase